MIYNVPEDFQRKLDEFNDAQGGPIKVSVCWDGKLRCWAAFAVPQGDLSTRGYNAEWAKMLGKSMPDGQVGVKIFNWREEDGTPMPLDDRIFLALKWADSFRDRRHFEETIEKPEVKKQLDKEKQVKEIAYAARNYWWSYDRLTINPHIRGPADWRHRIR